MPKLFRRSSGQTAAPRLLLAVVSLAALAFPGAPSAQPLQELYDKAKQEGELVLYGGGPTSLYEEPGRALGQK